MLIALPVIYAVDLISGGNVENEYSDFTDLSKTNSCAANWPCSNENCDAIGETTDTPINWPAEPSDTCASVKGTFRDSYFHGTGTIKNEISSIRGYAHLMYYGDIWKGNRYFFEQVPQNSANQLSSSTDVTLMEFAWCGEESDMTYDKQTLTPTTITTYTLDSGYNSECQDFYKNTLRLPSLRIGSNDNYVFDFFYSRGAYYTLPTPFTCDDIVIQNTASSNNDWNFPINKFSIGVYGGSKTSNGVNSISINIGSQQKKVTSIQISTKDYSSLNGGLALKIICKNAQMPDGDASSALCTSLGGAWGPTGAAAPKCCGDDAADEGMRVTVSPQTYVCSNKIWSLVPPTNTNVNTPLGGACPPPPDSPRSGYDCKELEQELPSGTKGMIKYLDKPKVEYLYDGSGWVRCKGTFPDGKTRKTLTDSNVGHTFMCIGSGRGSIVECCGAGTCLSAGSDGAQLTTGQSRIPKDFAGEAIQGHCDPKPNVELCNAPSEGFSSNANCPCPSNMQIDGTQRKCKQIPICDQCPTCGELNLDCCGTECNNGLECNNGKCTNPPTSGLPPAQVVASDFITGNVVAPTADCNCRDERPATCDSVDMETVYSCTGTAGYGCSDAASNPDPSTYYCTPDFRFVRDLDYYIKEDEYGGVFNKGPAEVHPNSILISRDQPPYAALDDYCDKGDTASKALCKSTCTGAGLKWSGTKCCSEGDDFIKGTQPATLALPTDYTCLIDPANTKAECYNDPTTQGGAAPDIGGCFNSTFIRTLNTVSENPPASGSVMNYNGEFYGCAIKNDSNRDLKKPTPGFRNFNTANDVLVQLNPDGTPLKLLDKFIPNRLLIKDRAHCNNIQTSSGFTYCAYNETWQNTPTNNARINLSYSPIIIANPTIEQQKREAGCCELTKCWDGRKCVDDQKDKPTDPPLINTNFRCIDGAWIGQSLKTALDGLTGYCGKESQCLIDPTETDINKQCTEPGQYIEDNYCESGNWSSRTKLVALKMMKIKNNIGASSDFTLFCDSRENTLNYLAYSVQNQQATAALTNLQPNNFCVLNANGRTFVGVSLNKKAEDLPSNMQVFGAASCAIPNTRDALYKKCISTNSKVWYNRNLSILIYSSTDAPEVQDATDNNQITLLAQLKQIIAAPFNFVSNIFRQASVAESSNYLDSVKRFDRLYMAKKGAKTIAGSLEDASVQKSIVEYKGLTFDMCQQISRYEQTTEDDEDSEISCTKSGNDYYISVYGGKNNGRCSTNICPEAIWPDITSKLRLT